MNALINFFNVGNSKLFTEGNAYGTVAITIIKITIDNDYTHILHGS